MSTWSFTLVVEPADYENAYRLTWRAQHHALIRTYVQIPRVLHTPEAVFDAAKDLRAFADWLEREAYRLSTGAP